MHKRITSSLVTSTLAVIAIALPMTTYSATLSYTNVDLGVVSTELEAGSVDVDGKGPFIRGSLAITPRYFLFGEIADIGYDRDYDSLSAILGFGGHLPITSMLDFVGKVGVVHQEIESGPYDADDNGIMLSATARGFVVQDLELEGGLRHVQMSDFANDTSLVAEGRYFFTPRLAGGVIVHVGDNSLVGVHVRFTF
ncbi:MAG: hypothetical protein H7Y02_01455 [Candidatus Obscuribacterales bacterium]|nr:hypothetical protein [Steroidobacteraceae bacterium]